jgi:hypothetical protein
VRESAQSSINANAGPHARAEYDLDAVQQQMQATFLAVNLKFQMLCVQKEGEPHASGSA